MAWVPTAAGAAGKASAEVVPGVPQSNKPELDVAKVRKTLGKNLRALGACFAPELEDDPAAAGVALLVVRLDGRGEVLASRLAGPIVASKSAPLAVCVRDAVATWKVAGVKMPGLAFRVPLTFGPASLLKKGPLRVSAAARAVTDPLPPKGSVAPPAVDDSAASGEAPAGYVLPAEVIPSGSEGEDEWVLDPVDVAGEPKPHGRAPSTAAPATAAPTDPPLADAPALRGKVEIANVRAGAGLDMLEVNEVVKTRLKELTACWNRAVAADPGLTGGKLILSLHVVTSTDKKYGGRGKVFSSAAVTREIGEPALSCIDDAVVYWLFPSPSGAPKSVVTATFTFSVSAAK